MEKKSESILKQLAAKKVYLIKGIVLAFFCLCAFFTIKNVYHSIREQYSVDLKQEADECFKQEKYALAIKKYNRVVKMQCNNYMESVKALSEVYVELKNYPMAAEVLNDCYQVSKDREIRDQMNKVYQLLREKKYENSIEKSKNYLESQAYDRAILELKRALELEPNSEEVIRMLVCAYISENETEQAMLLLSDKKTIISRDTYTELNRAIDHEIDTEKYDQILKQADELLLQENYEEGFAKYQEAINLIPNRMDAYRRVVEAYNNLKKYNESISILKKGMQSNTSQEMYDLLWKTKGMVTIYDTRKDLLKRIYYAMKADNMEELLQILQSKDYSNAFEENIGYYYNISKDEITDQIEQGIGCAIYADGSIYVGDFFHGVRHGRGSLYYRQKNLLGYCYFSGDWRNDIANGRGSYLSSMYAKLEEGNKEYMVRVTGNFHNNMEHGRMLRILYEDGHLKGRLIYTSNDGIPQPMDDKILTEMHDKTYEYTIGTITTTDKNYICTYHLGKDILWGIKE